MQSRRVFLQLIEKNPVQLDKTFTLIKVFEANLKTQFDVVIHRLVSRAPVAEPPVRERSKEQLSLFSQTQPAQVQPREKHNAVQTSCMRSSLK